uniref:hypothetical protein n=1 Tax=Algoriphagus sp. TaxID=1872435 RepID=UPI0025865CEB|nr:hypothetical protein [Algoriphagus sp.]
MQLRIVKFKLGIYFIFLFSCFNAFSQEFEKKGEEKFSLLRKEVARIIIRHPGESDNMKFIAYSFLIVYGDSITIKYSEQTPQSILQKNETVNPVPKLKKFMEEKGISFDSEVTVLYTILHIWDDKKERENNLAMVFENMYDQGLGFLSSSEVRVEIPIVTRLSPVIN